MEPGGDDGIASWWATRPRMPPPSPAFPAFLPRVNFNPLSVLGCAAFGHPSSVRLRSSPRCFSCVLVPAPSLLPPSCRLSSLGLSCHLPNFLREEVDLDALPHLSDKDLQVAWPPRPTCSPLSWAPANHSPSVPSCAGPRRGRRRAEAAGPARGCSPFGPWRWEAAPLCPGRPLRGISRPPASPVL